MKEPQATTVKPHAGRFWLRAAAAGVFSLGFTALLGSFVIEPLLPKTLGWGREDTITFRAAEKQFAEMQRKVAEARLRSPELPGDPVALQLARTEVNRLLIRMNQARDRPRFVVLALRYSGVVLTAVGVAMIVTTRRRAESLTPSSSADAPSR